MTRKIHLHDEQFDNHYHAACGRFPYDPASNEKEAKYIVSEVVFNELPRKVRCAYCTNYWWPKGFGDPE